ncbi:sodium/proton antiporter (NhaD family) [Balneicella halophila]|uniref:Sodium/proton antiporter (NhaD family) n=1 Tax=Balneicella halophila TaxID=1537566 RepID=A0A7L4URZ7_BALHA|nr:sodium:proton antiporter NhaD [Balneicella halophila]PVX51987.1 sodium/proton antiporter (NhaD family) [Balneicella halophila]
MISLVVAIFIIGYLCIAFEHPLRLDKTAPALLMAALCWAVYAIGFRNSGMPLLDMNTHQELFYDPSIGHESFDSFLQVLLHHLGKTAEILIFLIGAMTIVEIIDLHNGFAIIKQWVKTRNKKKLLWIVAILAFVLSAIIDNLTATIVLITILRKLIHDRPTRLWYAGLIVIAANAGGAWSPIGDVTTTMLWIANKTSVALLIEHLLLPSAICMLVPVIIASMLPPFKGDIPEAPANSEEELLLSSKTILFLGLGGILSVPFFKTFTHLPPWVGMILALSIVWLVSEYVIPERDWTHEKRRKYSVHKALAKIEMNSILFFLGILMAVAALESIGVLFHAQEWLTETVPNTNVVILLLGVASAIIDNVPLVAASIGMYGSAFPIDHSAWHFIAYAAGTGGSMLIIGSAAGVAAMGMERINFIWYLKKITWLAVLGYLAGALVFYLMFGVHVAG